MQKKSEIINILILCIAAPAAVIGGFFLLSNKSSYILSALILIIAMLPFFISFERKNTGAREIVTIASLSAIAAVSRAAFYILPQIKPVAAIVIIAAVSFGYEVGFMVGAMSMFLSGMLFGQGLWTPFQMLGLGLVGLASGLIFHNSKLKHNRIALSIFGGLLTFFIYGFIVDTNSVLYLSTNITLSSALSIYASGVTMNAVFAVTTAVVLFFFGKTFIQKLERLKTKYGIFDKYTK